MQAPILYMTITHRDLSEHAEVGLRVIKLQKDVVWLEVGMSAGRHAWMSVGVTNSTRWSSVGVTAHVSLVSV